MISNFDDLGEEDIPFLPGEKLGVPYENSSGFPGITFKDSHGFDSYIQMSSLCEGYPPGQSALWIGKDKNAMHLTRDQVICLVYELDSWLSNGIFLHQEKEGWE